MKRLMMLILIVLLMGGCAAESVPNQNSTSTWDEMQCKDCGSHGVDYCVGFNTDNRRYYCFSCYWDNHKGEQAAQLSR